MKKTIYIILASLLGLLLALTANALIEMWVIDNSLAHGQLPYPYNYIVASGYLPTWFGAALLFVGMVVGFLLGHSWWRIVYIEKRHWTGWGQPQKAQKKSPRRKR